LGGYRKVFISNTINILNNSREFKAIDIEKKKYIINIVNNFLVTFFKELEIHSFLLFKNRLTVVGPKVNPFLLSVISKRFKRDIYLIDGINKLPYKIEQIDNRGRKSIVLLRIENSFELIGRILPNKEIGYEFESGDKFIKKLNMFLCNPEDIRDSYPELSQFLSIAHSAKSPRNLYSSDSEDEEQKSKVNHKPPPRRREEPSNQDEPRREPTRREAPSQEEHQRREEPPDREESNEPPRREPRSEVLRREARNESQYFPEFQYRSEPNSRGQNEAKPKNNQRGEENEPQMRRSLKDFMYESSSDDSN
jgi:hypothetical protein